MNCRFATSPALRPVRERIDPAALLLISLGAANALAVYPQLARGLFGCDGRSSEVVEHYAAQLAQLITPSCDSTTGPPGRRAAAR